MLFNLGFGYAWMPQSVTNRTYVISLFKQRLRDQYIQQWFTSVSTRSSCSLYKNITNRFRCQNYFHMAFYAPSMHLYVCTQILNLLLGKLTNIIYHIYIDIYIYTRTSPHGYILHPTTWLNFIMTDQLKLIICQCRDISSTPNLVFIYLLLFSNILFIWTPRNTEVYSHIVKSWMVLPNKYSYSFS